jgi:hypothetical protein
MRFGQNQHQKSKDASSEFWKIIKRSQPAVLEGKMISQRRSSRSLSKLSNNSVDLTEDSSIERRGGVLIVLKETGCGAKSIRICEGLSYEPTKINGPIRVLGFGVLGFKTALDLTGAAFLGAAGTRRRVARVVFGEPTLLTGGIDVFFKTFGLESF